jgi:two-component system OmpR family sensor kinase/two-component system sensor histidine kinase BaeS
MRRAALWFLGFVVTLVAIVMVSVWLVGNVLGINEASTGLRLVSLALLILAFFGLAGGGRMFRRFARPVEELVEGASQIEAGDFTVRVRERGPREVRTVARAFNAMAEQLQATDDRRRAFLADVTHELRTPLSVVRGRAEGIMDGVYPGDKEHVAPMLEAARTLERLIEDLRTLALADAGGLTLRREDVDLPLLVHETLSGFEQLARDAGVQLSANVARDLPVITADPSRLQSVLSNVVSNAMRHTPAGGSVRVAASRSGEAIEVTVSDTGEGIPADVLPHIFDRFVKTPGSPGSGLGLAIARDLVVAHGGQIEASSSPGSGTTIRFTLPAQAG